MEDLLALILDQEHKINQFSALGRATPFSVSKRVWINIPLLCLLSIIDLPHCSIILPDLAFVATDHLFVEGPVPANNLN
jgi:hypothetical protein